MKDQLKIFWIDLFCGAGGTTTGVHLANSNKNVHTEVVACVNHDENAIKSHESNHPNCIHYTEDIRDFEVVKKLKKLVAKLRLENPGCLINIWASLECTNFSKAKGGMPRDADSRTLADHIFMYIEELDPDYLWIENVVEFMSWGPLDDNGKPESRKRGKDYLRWIDKIRDYGYKFDWRQLNSADFGAYTARNRYFAQFPKKGLPIAWPVKTHTKKPSKGDSLFNNPLKPWKPVKEVLNLENEGKSIFNRKKPLVDNTLKRIYAGLVKFVANGDDSFIKKYYSGRPSGKVISVNEPCPTVSTRDRFGKISYLMMNYSNSQSRDINKPAATIVNNDKHNLITADRFILNPQFKNRGNSVEKPAPTVIARQDKKPLGLIACERGEGFYIPVYKDDSEIMIQIKIFMAHFGIVDIKMRTLLVEELLKIQGFPEGYKLVGTQTDQKKFIGNSVEVKTAKAIVSATYEAISEKLEMAA